MDSSVSTGAGLTGLSSASAGLIISTIQIGEATATTYTQAGSTIESIATLGTYAAPTATKCRFKEVDATNHPGIYEIQLADARFASAARSNLLISISGATNLAQADVEVQMSNLDSNMVSIDGQLTTGNNATLNLKKLSVVNDAGTAVVIQATTAAGGYGIDVQGLGSGAAMRLTGGDNGPGMEVYGGISAGKGVIISSGNDLGLYVAGQTGGATIESITSGNGVTINGVGSDGVHIEGQAAGMHIKSTGSDNGVTVEAGTGGAGIKATGEGVGSGIEATGGATGSGLRAIASGASANAIEAIAGGTGSYGLYVEGKQAGLSVLSSATDGYGALFNGVGTGSGIRVSAGGTGNGVEILGDGSGHGVSIEGGATGNGINVKGGATSGDGINVDASSGNGISVKGGSTSGNGMDISAQATNGYGVNIAGTGTGSGMNIAGGGTGSGLKVSGGGSSGNGIEAIAPADGIGISASGGGSGSGMQAYGGATGAGFQAIGGATSGSGIEATATTSGHGIDASGGGTNGDGMLLTRGGASGYDLAGATPSTNLPVPGVVDSNMVSIDGQLTTGNNATLNLKQLNIQNDTDEAVLFASTGSNKEGLKVTSATGNAVHISGDDNGVHIEASGASSSGILTHAVNAGINAYGGAAGVLAEGTGAAGIGLKAVGAGSGEGVAATGGATGNGLKALGGATSGDGIYAAASTDGNGLKALGGATSGDGIYAAATTEGNGLQAIGVGSSVNGIKANGDGLGAGISATGGVAAGAGMLLTKGAGATNDLEGATPSTNLPFPPAGTIDSNVVSIDSVSAAAVQLAKSAQTIVSGVIDDTAFAPTTTQFECSDIIDAAADFYIDRTVIIASGALVNQARRIVGYSLVSGRGHFTVEALTSAPVDLTNIVIV